MNTLQYNLQSEDHVRREKIQKKRYISDCVSVIMDISTIDEV